MMKVLKTDPGHNNRLENRVNEIASGRAGRPRRRGHAYGTFSSMMACGRHPHKTAEH